MLLNNLSEYYQIMSLEKHSARSEHNSSHSANSHHDEEFDLFDLVAKLWNGKIIILSSIVIMVILAAIYLLFAKEKWTSETIITQPAAGQVATFNNALSVLYVQNIEDKVSLPDLQRQIFGRYIASAYALSGTLRNLEEPLDLKVRPVTAGKDDPISITFTGSSPKQAQQKLSHYLNELNKNVSDDFAIDMRSNIFVRQNGLKDSIAAQEKIAQDKKEHRIDVMKQAMKIAEAAKIEKSNLSQAEFLSDDTLYLLGTSALSSMIANEKSKPLEYNDYYYASQRALLSLNNLRIDFSRMQNFQYIKKPDLPIYRDSPKKSLTLLLAIILGGIIGSGIVIIRNIFDIRRTRNNEI
ncbi:LPS O-antigen chain length determinant protein WzzB [Erwinia sp. P7711]|uniref:LPS O-antigen chain length determinant protein WzzB n=1 Tax=Erwinia sp. P7711 TaxID=3141451 RepID=UPI00319D0D0F